MKNVPLMPRPSSSSARIRIPLSEDEKRGPVPEPRSMDPAATLPGIGMFTSRSASTVKYSFGLIPSREPTRLSSGAFPR